MKYIVERGNYDVEVVNADNMGLSPLSLFFTDLEGTVVKTFNHNGGWLSVTEAE